MGRCAHEEQRLDRGGEIGAVLREGTIVCPKHGSAFDACEGDCGNGPAAGSTVLSIDISANRGDVFLTDDDYEFVGEGRIDGNDGPSSSSHLPF